MVHHRHAELRLGPVERIRVAPLAGKITESEMVTESIMLQAYPTYRAPLVDDAAETEMQWVMQFILGVRKIKGEMNIAPGKPVPVLLANASRLGFVVVLARTIIEAMLRALGFVIGKVPALAADELVAVAGALRPSQLLVARRWRAASGRTGSVAGLRPTISGTWTATDDGVAVRDRQQRRAGHGGGIRRDCRAGLLPGSRWCS